MLQGLLTGTYFCQRRLQRRVLTKLLGSGSQKCGSKIGGEADLLWSKPRGKSRISCDRFQAC